MSTRTKVLLIVVAVVLVGCFAASVGNGGGTGAGDSSSNGFVDFLGRRAGQANAVFDDQIRTDCRVEPNRFRFAGTCSLDVDGGGTGLRSLKLTTDQPIIVTSRVPRKDFTVSDDVSPGEELTVAIDEQGGAVVLACAPLATCVVTLASEV